MCVCVIEFGERACVFRVPYHVSRGAPVPSPRSPAQFARRVGVPDLARGRETRGGLGDATQATRLYGLWIVTDDATVSCEKELKQAHAPSSHSTQTCQTDRIGRPMRAEMQGNPGR